MQIEVVQFLLEARHHFRSQPGDGDPPHHDDLQAVERALPDCDWFELEEFRTDKGPDALRWEADMVDIEF
jgi:hypothetical protein